MYIYIRPRPAIVLPHVSFRGEMEESAVRRRAVQKVSAGASAGGEIHLPASIIERIFLSFFSFFSFLGGTR